MANSGRTDFVLPLIFGVVAHVTLYWGLHAATHAAAPFFPDNTPITFAATGGTMAPTSVPTASGKASSNFTATAAGSSSARATRPRH